ncbi:MAG: hypothetical protein CMJ81_06560 [Planctomycetaceae bacterium]|jgi:hypothetical protein|nr:hypothetical protein [Planctomycetaceae bacterium]MBP63104.1 hypothetical protein [Planctomycetaceae bacterium]
MGGDIICATGAVFFTRLVKHVPACRGGAPLNVGRKSDKNNNFGDGAGATVWWCRVIERTYAIPWESQQTAQFVLVELTLMITFNI